MIETKILNYLKSRSDLATIPIYVGEKPITKNIDEYVVFRVIDYGRINQVDAVTLDFYSYSNTLNKAAILDSKVKDAMFDAITLNYITSSTCGRSSQNMDIGTKSYCYECVFNLYYYSTEV